MEFAIPAAIHPIFVHFAIALTLFGVGLDAFAFFSGRTALHQAAKFNLVGGVFGLATATLTGWFDHERWHASAIHTHTHDALNFMTVHQYLGICLLVFFALLVFWRLRFTSSVPRLFVILALFGALGIVAQGYIGGQLVFEQGTGVSMPHEHDEHDEDYSSDHDDDHHDAHTHTHTPEIPQ